MSSSNTWNGGGVDSQNEITLLLPKEEETEAGQAETTDVYNK